MYIFLFWWILTITVNWYVERYPLSSNRHNRSDCLDSGGQEGKLSGLFCAELCAKIVHSEMHTHVNGSNSSLDWVLSHWAHFTVLRFLFTARRNYASAVLAVLILSVCLSVHMFVCHTRALWLIQRTYRRYFLYHMKAQSFCFLPPKISAKFQRGHPRRGAK